MNSLFILPGSLTTKSGDVLTGEVLMEVGSPTSGYELRLKLIGAEKCVQWVDNSENPIIHFDKPTISDEESCDILLWESDGVFPLGKFKISFQFDIPKDLPGSFKSSTVDGFEILLIYFLEAYVKGDEWFKDQVEIYVDQSDLCTAEGTVRVSNITHDINQFLGLSKGQLHLDVRLANDKVFTTEDTIKISYTITNSSKTYKIVKQYVQLKRVLIAKLPNLSKEWETPLKEVTLLNSDKSESYLPLSTVKYLGTSEGTISSQFIKCKFLLRLIVVMDDNETFRTEDLEILIQPKPYSNHAASNYENEEIKTSRLYLDALSLDDMH